MAIPVQQFPILSAQAANPLGAGLAAGGNLVQQFIQNHFLKNNEQEHLQKQQLANALAHIQLQFAPENMQTSMAYKSAQIPYLQAQTEKAKQATQLAPLDALIKAQQAAQVGSRFGGAYQMARALQAMSPAARQLWVAQNQSQYNQMIADLGNQTRANFVTPEILKKYFPQLEPSPEQTSPSKDMNILGSALNQKAHFNSPTDDHVQQTQLANQISANNALTTTATRRQYEGALQVESIFNDKDFQSQAQNAAVYAGAIGKGKAASTALSQTNPKAYEDYLAFKYQTLPLLESRIKTLDQMGATDTQRQLLENMLGKTANALTSNPQQFIIQLNALGKTLNLVARSVQSSVSPLTPMNRVKDFSAISEATKSINSKTYHKIQGTVGGVMKAVTDPEILKQLNESGIPTLENKKSSTLSQLTGNPIFRFLAGAGGGIQNSLANLPYSPVPHVPSSQGLSGKIGDIAGNLLSFVGGGEVLNTARAASESLPLMGRLAKTLSGDGSAGIARRLSGTALGGALENPNDRMQGAENGALLAGAGESIPLALKGIHQAAEFINPQHFTNKLATSIKAAYESSKAEAKKYYAAVLDHFGEEKISSHQSLNHYAEWNKKDSLTAYDSKLRDLHQDFINNPTLEKAHQLQSQLGSKSSQLTNSKHFDIHTHNAIADLKRARSALQGDISNFLQKKNSNVLSQYQRASKFYKNTVIPYHSEPFISKIAAGDVKTSTPKKLSHALTSLSEKEALPSHHYLQQALEHLNSKINRGKMTSQLASLLAGAGIGELANPGGLGALGGLVGGGAAHHYVLPKLLDLAANPYATQQLKKLNPTYRLLIKSLVANQLTSNNKESS